MGLGETLAKPAYATNVGAVLCGQGPQERAGETGDGDFVGSARKVVARCWNVIRNYI